MRVGVRVGLEVRWRGGCWYGHPWLFVTVAIGVGFSVQMVFAPAMGPESYRTIDAKVGASFQTVL